jgi:RimJ/RimL family protein N-acetyltransferase
MVELRPMEPGDLALVERWLAEPHVAHWYLAGSSLEAELEDIRLSAAGAHEVHMSLVFLDGEPVGWCQWYRCDVDPVWAAEIGAEPDDCGIDYAIGEAARVGGGTGTELIAALVGLVRAARPGCGIVADPDARNAASRRVLEKNGFGLVAVKAMASEPTDDPMAVYRLPGSVDPETAESAPS